MVLVDVGNFVKVGMLKNICMAMLEHMLNLFISDSLLISWFVNLSISLNTLNSKWFKKR